MEFPSLGEHCQFEDCNQTDFLPFQCRCDKVFCRIHFNEHCLSGCCELAPKPKEVNLIKDTNIYRCSEKGCRKGNYNEMLCSKCAKHYCIDHRFHPSCPEIDDETMAAKIEEFAAPRRQFAEANKHLQDRITENIRKALQSSAKYKTASKIHLMRIKQKAKGLKTISPKDRIYFAIVKPKDITAKNVSITYELDENCKVDETVLEPDLKNAEPIFISKSWSLGRAMDSICDTCNIKNNNNILGCPKLRIFRQVDGYCISPVRMDVEIRELLENEVLVEGDRLKVDYVSEEVLKTLNENSTLFLEC